MERINIPVSIQNLANIDKVQSKQEHFPVNVALQNAETNNTKQEEKLQKPNEVDEAEGQVIDPDKKKEQPQEKGKKREKKKKISKENRAKDSGKFIDFSV